MPNSLTAVPATITAGDSYTITLSLTDYPATAGWSVALSVAGVSVKQWTSAASGAAHVLTLTAADTSMLSAGVYQWVAKAITTGRVETFDRGALAVAADVAAMGPGDGTSYWATLKAAAESALLALMDGGAVQMVMVMGRQTMFRSPDDCLKVIARCNAELSRTRSGSAFGKVSVAFTR